MNKNKTLATIVVFLAFFVAISALRPLPLRAATGELIMGLASADSKKVVLDAWQPVLDDLSKALGVPVRGMVMDDYAGVIWSLSTGRAQFAWMGNKAAIKAVDRARCEIVAQSRTLLGAGYYAHLITRKSSSYETERDVLGHASEIRFGIGDPNSTSGFTVPSYYLFASKNINPRSVFKDLEHHNHEGNFHAVASGDLDVATSNSSALARYQARFPKEFAKVKIIWTSPLIPSDPIVVSKDLSSALRLTLTRFLVQYAKPGPGKSAAEVQQEKKNLMARKWTGFSSSDNSQLEPIRRLELYKKRLRIERDETLTDTDRTTRLREVDEQLQSLDK